MVILHRAVQQLAQHLAQQTIVELELMTLPRMPMLHLESMLKVWMQLDAQASLFVANQGQQSTVLVAQLLALAIGLFMRRGLQL